MNKILLGVVLLILTGCGSESVGTKTPAMFENKGWVDFSSTTGFRVYQHKVSGNCYAAHCRALSKVDCEDFGGKTSETVRREKLTLERQEYLRLKEKFENGEGL